MKDVKTISAVICAAAAACVFACMTAFAAEPGDVTLDGRITSTDIVSTAAHVKSVKNLSGEAADAADVNNDGSITATDISIIAAHVKGIRTIDGYEAPAHESYEYDPREYARLRGGALVHTNKPYDGFADDIHSYLSWVNDLSDTELAYFNFDMGCMTDRDWQLICDDCWDHIHDKYGYLSNIKFEENNDYFVNFDENGKCLDWKGSFGFGIRSAGFRVNENGEACVDEHNIDWYYENFIEIKEHFYEEIDDCIDCHQYTENDNYVQYIHLNYYYHAPGHDYVFICQHD